MSSTITTEHPAAYPPRLQAIGTEGAPYRALLALAELPLASMRRVTVGELDVLLVHTERGIFATDDRCPHMSAPLSIGELDGCILGCPLHEGRFDLVSGDTAQMPTTGGLDAGCITRPGHRPGRTPRSTRPAGRPRRGS